MKQIIRIGVIVAPWLMAVALPIFLFPGFVDSNTGIVDPIHLLGFEFVLIPLAPLMMLRCLLANPACSLELKLLLFAVGDRLAAVSPLCSHPTVRLYDATKRNRPPQIYCNLSCRKTSKRTK